MTREMEQQILAILRAAGCPMTTGEIAAALNIPQPYSLYYRDGCGRYQQLTKSIRSLKAFKMIRPAGRRFNALMYEVIE